MPAEPEGLELAKSRRIRTLITGGAEEDLRALLCSLDSVAMIEVVGAAGSCSGALRLCETLQPDLLIVANHFPSSDSKDFCKAVWMLSPRIAVFLTSREAHCPPDFATPERTLAEESDWLRHLPEVVARLLSEFESRNRDSL